MNDHRATLRYWQWTVTGMGWAGFVLVTMQVPFADVWRWTTTVAAVSAMGFVVTYWLVAPWWRSAIGWNLQVMAVSLAAAFGMIAWRAWTGAPVNPLAWLWVTVAFTVTILWRTALLLTENHRRRDA